MAQRFYIETLGCPKNQVDSDKLVGTLLADGLPARDVADDADLVVVNTCAFIEEARQESIDTILAPRRRASDRRALVVTGCIAERYGDELAAALPEVDAVAGFGVPVTLGSQAGRDRPDVRPAEPAAAARDAPVGLREGRRGLRPHVRLLRDPVVPRAAAQPHRRLDPRRGRRSSTRAGDRARRAGPGVATATTSRARRRRHRARWSRRSRRGAIGYGCSTCIPLTSPMV